MGDKENTSLTRIHKKHFQESQSRLGQEHIRDRGPANVNGNENAFGETCLGTRSVWDWEQGIEKYGNKSDAR